MLIHSAKTLSLTAALALAATASWAQNAPAPQPVTRVGVTPQDSHEAVQKAAPNATATLVRTEPSAAEQAREKAEDAKNGAKPTKTPPSASTPPSGDSMNERASTPSHPNKTTGGKTTGTVTNSTTPSDAMGITGTTPGGKPTSGTGSPVTDRAHPQSSPGK